jgi:type I restriction enzyme S subunit
VAPIDIQKEIIETLKSINIRIHINEKESRRLAELRDTLLPRLMSGELKVNDLENNEI